MQLSSLSFRDPHSFEQTSERSFFEKGEATFSRPPTSFTRQSLYVSGAYAALP